MSSAPDRSGPTPRSFWRPAWDRVRTNVWSVLQQSAAAGLAWALAGWLVEGDHHPFFAPIAAVVALNTGFGVRGVQAVNLLTGTLIGIVVGASAVWLVSAPSMALVVATLVAMLIAVAVGAARVTIAQAAAAAILTVTIPYGGDGGPQRLFDAALGVGVALVFSQLVFPTHPLRLLSQAEHALAFHLHRLLARTAHVADQRDDAQSEVQDALVSTHTAIADLESARSAALHIVDRTLRGVYLRRRTRTRVEAAGPLEGVAVMCTLVATTVLSAPEGSQTVLASVVRDIADVFARVAQAPPTDGTWGAAAFWDAAALRAEELHETLPGLRTHLADSGPETDAAISAIGILCETLRRTAT
ncbi:aromatic acid exporter family protein [Nocardiopsis sp. JB363]|uniref:FUSC family protein n=1 Tax=Nocardiopsis sp. JB363 TaxID=1434837 RepID=UPI00135865C9|nr:FUSC family protein [Nocardiopsis sp. JB363]